MSIDISVKYDDKVPAAVDKLAGTFFDEIVDDVIHPYLDDVAHRARNKHRYKRRSGKLERAIIVDKDSDGGTVSINDGLAPYGEHVHEGHGTWAADQFIFDAENDRMLDQMLDRKFQEILNKLGK